MPIQQSDAPGVPHAREAPDALVLVDHGSRLASANEMLEPLAAMVRKIQPLPVYIAHMELAEPTIQQAFDAAVENGARFVFVFPYFLSPWPSRFGGHAFHLAMVMPDHSQIKKRSQKYFL